MIKKMMNLFAFFVPLLLQAQVTISVQLPAVGLIQKDQLWNLVLSNGGNTAVEATLLLNLQDAVTGQSVLTAGTRSLILAKGVKMINARDLQPVQYNYYTGGLNSNYLPLGSYVACYTVVRSGGEKMESLADACVRVNISPLSPPLLSTPADESILHTALPQLSWMPPAPLEMFDDISYDISVAEVMEGQSPLEAVLYNTPVFVKSHAKVLYENYPSSYSKLETGKTYAWQVTARNGQNYAATTEVWTFSIAGDSAAVVPVNTTYILLKNSNSQSGVSYISGDNLNVRYYSFDKEHETTIRFLNIDGRVIQEKKQKIIYGDNFLSFKLNNSYHPGTVYILEIKDLQSNRHTAAFSKKQPN